VGHSVHRDVQADTNLSELSLVILTSRFEATQGIFGGVFPRKCPCSSSRTSAPS
ncbi:unnamed protein product, partial [Larinioides sclopetarius]